MRFAIVLSIAVVLTGCDAPPATQPQADGQGAASAPAPAPDPGPALQGAPDQPVNDTEEQAADMIPARYQGIWDYEGGTCAPESDLRMEISGREILFYESVGTVTGVTSEGADIIVTLDIEGEGETWVQTTRLSLEGEDAGNPEAQRLHTSDGEKPREPDEYPSKRCLAGAA